MNLQDKKVMILGASYSQIPLIEAAKKLGVKTVVATLPGENPGMTVADEIYFGDLRDREDILLGAKKHNINGVATCCMDTGIRTLGYVCERMKLPGISEAVGEACSNKALMKDKLIKGNVNTAKYEVVRNLEQLKLTATNIGFPLVVKAVDLQGSQGVYIVNNLKKATECFYEIMELTNVDFCIVEQYIKGYELGAEAFIFDGDIKFILPHKKDTFFTNTAVPIGHSAPFEESKDIINQVIEQITLAIESMGLNNCAVNVDLIVEDGKVYIIELTGRIGATGLPELVNTYYGINIYEWIILNSIGENPAIDFNIENIETTPCLTQLLISNKSGTVKKISLDGIDNSNILDLSLNIGIGSTIKKFSNGSDRIGQIIIKGKSLKYCYDLLDKTQKNIYIEVESQ